MGEQRTGAGEVSRIAAEAGFSTEAAEAVYDALRASGGRMAQFSHPELGGMGQWSPGMLMIGDMFNNGLKARVDRLCSALADLAQREPATPSGGGRSSNWWPQEFGTPSAAGSQNDTKYAFFPDARRLALSEDGRVRIFDTGDHMISGVAQQQGSGRSVSFSSQRGEVRLGDLRDVTQDGAPAPAAKADSDAPTPQPPPRDEPAAEPAAKSAAKPEAKPADAPASAAAHDEIFAKLERLAELHKRGVVSDDEFSTKKTELLSRL
ncbi:MAG TPA: SHOCT domain-containing protein [Xanthobacteraceae bacterium]|nr:SHOCT domain-containing protein [Xanthobacteraceae bacterium]